MSLPEVLIWQRLRHDSVGVRVRHQHPIGPYKADFYCAKARLVIEIDGEAHNRGDQPVRDAERDRFMADNGYRVLRIAAADVLRNPDEVAQSIALLVASPLHHSPKRASGPPPRAGEER